MTRRRKVPHYFQAAAWPSRIPAVPGTKRADGERIGCLPHIASDHELLCRMWQIVWSRTEGLADAPVSAGGLSGPDVHSIRPDARRRQRIGVRFKHVGV